MVKDRYIWRVKIRVADSTCYFLNKLIVLPKHIQLFDHVYGIA